MSGSPLPVSVLAGPSVATLIEAIGSINPRIRLGLLTSSRESEDSARHSILLVERLPSLSHGQVHDPVRIAEQIRAIADRRAVDHLLLECDPDTPAMAFASLFVPQGDSPHSLGEATRLTTAVLALTPSLLLNKLVHRVGMEDPPSPCFLADQLEFVPAVFLEGAAGSPDYELARHIVMTLNPRTQVSELSPNSLEAFLLNPGSFDFASALESAAWRQLIDDPTDRSRDNISAFAYCSRKPFHPERFWNLLQQELPGIFRAKGFFWLATRMDLAGGLNLAGAESYYAAAGNWWAARDEQTRDLHMPERTRREWKEPYGDRRQAIAFMGIDHDPGALKKQLDACLLSDAEMAAGPESWRRFVDPFPSWVHHHHPHDPDHEHEHDCDCDHAHDHEHDQGSDQPGCCSH